MTFEIIKELEAATPELIITTSKPDLTSVIAELGLHNTPTFSGKKGEFISLPSVTQSGEKYILGLGEKPSSEILETELARLIRNNREALAAAWQVDVGAISQTLGLTQEAIMESLVCAVSAGFHVVSNYKTEDDDKESSRTVQLKCDHPESKRLLQDAQVIGSVQSEVRNLVDAPANKLTPEALAAWASDKAGSIPGLEVSVMDETQIQEEGLQALYAVGKGSANPPRFIICEYKTDPGNPTVGLVGKGVTFDTGGLSIKPSQSMHLMKSDMAGAAAVLGAVAAISSLALPVNLIGIVPAAENSVDATSTRPGDVIDSFSGKTIEVTDTDAEGRLILADGLAYLIANYEPQVIVDMATLTGSCVRALGFAAAGVFTANDQLTAQLEAAGVATNERLWRLPIWSAYDSYLHSDVADVKNFSGKPEAGAISAAKFLEAFTSNHPAWAHIDMAGTAFGSDQGGKDKSATGYGVRLITNFVSNLSLSDLSTS